MRSKLLLLLFSLSLNICYSQKQAWHWYFGEKAGLDFSTGIPVPTSDGLITAPYEASEGTGCISDADGNLLFYTNGDGFDTSCTNTKVGAIWNNLHQVMDQGILNDSMGGGVSSRQGSIIIPKPGSLTQYYLFTIDDVESITADPNSCYMPDPYPDGGGLKYFLIDMSLNSGAGQVIESNRNLLPIAYESVDATQHENGRDYWLTCTTGWSSLNTSLPAVDSICIFLVSENGISSPVKYPANCFTDYIKFSPSGERLFQASSQTLYDFNKTTGAISNPQYINTYNATPLDFCFSPNSNYLYSTEFVNAGFNYNHKIFQYDLNATDISASKLEIGSTVVRPITGAFYLSNQMSIGPDGKIYQSVYRADDPSLPGHIDVINCPNKRGVAAGFQEQALSPAAGTNVSLGLPNFMDYWLRSEDSCGLSISANFVYLNNCYSDSVDFIDQSYNNIISWYWNFGDVASGADNVSTIQHPKHKYSSPGIYSVTLLVNDGITNHTVYHDIEVKSCLEGLGNTPEITQTNSYPNPCNESFTFNWETVPTNLHLYDKTGRLILSQKISFGKNEIQTVNLANGIYLFSIEGNGIHSNGKIMVVH